MIHRVAPDYVASDSNDASLVTPLKGVATCGLFYLGFTPGIRVTPAKAG